MKNLTNDILNLFNFDYQELIVLFSLETIYVKKDIENTPSPKKELKSKVDEYKKNAKKDEIKNIEKSIIYLEKALERNKQILSKYNKPVRKKIKIKIR